MTRKAIRLLKHQKLWNHSPKKRGRKMKRWQVRSLFWFKVWRWYQLGNIKQNTSNQTENDLQNCSLDNHQEGRIANSFFTTAIFFATKKRWITVSNISPPVLFLIATISLLYKNIFGWTKPTAFTRKKTRLGSSLF